MLDPVFQIEGVVALDLNEGTNRVWIGTESLDIHDQILSVASKLGIPQEAIQIEKRPPGERVNLTWKRDNLRGGLEVQAYDVCTLGVLAEMYDSQNSYYEYGYITATHCTAGTSGPENDAGVLGGDLDQSEAGDSDSKIGFETVDPVYFTSSSDPDCPSGYPCRYTDAAFFERDIEDSNRDYEIGKIWRTTSVGSSTPDNPPLGKNSGWTGGKVQNTCTVQIFDGVATLCSTGASVSVQGGDSGAPVFHRLGSYKSCGHLDPCENVSLRGIVYASAGGTMYYSEWTAIVQELASMGVSY